MKPATQGPLMRCYRCHRDVDPDARYWLRTDAGLPWKKVCDDRCANLARAERVERVLVQDPLFTREPGEDDDT